MISADTYIFHIVFKDNWQAARAESEYLGDTLSTEGFIHCSTEEQVVRTANRVFRGRKGLVVLKINCQEVVSPIIYEDISGTGEDFPHIYGPLNVSAVDSIQELTLGADGLFVPLSQQWKAP
jgi:uncharacterized protein (DUF952 family)